LQENISSTSGTKLGDDVPVYDMPLQFDPTNKDQSSEKVSNLRNVLVSFAKLLL
jgi:hypothetical protein